MFGGCDADRSTIEDDWFSSGKRYYILYNLEIRIAFGNVFMMSENYKTLQPVLEEVNRRFISLDDDTVKRNNGDLIYIVENVMETMKNLDDKFKTLFEKLLYTGSYYEGLKIRSPHEYDIDMLLTLPKCDRCKVKHCDCVDIDTSDENPGFVKFGLRKGCCPILEQYTVELGGITYVDIDEIRKWIRGLLHRALNKLADRRYNYKDSGPAITLVIDEEIHVDLVPCFKFEAKHWPRDFKQFKTELGFIIVPKRYDNEDQILWRTSFPVQESKMIGRLNHVKPALRLLKKCRDTWQQTQIKSYFLKTLVLWELDSINGNDNLGNVFMKLLKKYRGALQSGTINNFWYPRHNLLLSVTNNRTRDETLKNYHGRINGIISEIDKSYLENPQIVAKHILTKDEYKTYVGDNMTSKEETNQTEQLSGISGREIASQLAVVGLIGGLAIGSFYYWRNRNR